MRFCVFALSSVPDTATTRQLFDLQDLDDKSVSKVMFHRRKQQTGSSEVLRWDQRSIASLTLIGHTADTLQFDSMHLGRHSEEAMLGAFFQSAVDHDRMLSWGGESLEIPLVHFRALKHALVYPAYWQALKAGGDQHLDIRNRLSPPGSDLPTLHATARKLGFPGLLKRTENDILDAWLGGRFEEVRAFSDLAALSTYLLALRLFTVTGELSQRDYTEIQERLLGELGKRDDPHLGEFIAAWGRV